MPSVMSMAKIFLWVHAPRRPDSRIVKDGYHKIFTDLAATAPGSGPGPCLSEWETTVRKLWTCLIAASLAPVAAGVQAQGVTFDTRISNIAFGVLDLTPDDGNAAAYSYAFSGSRYRVSMTGPGGKQEIDDTVSGLQAVTHTLTEGPSHAGLAVSGIPGEFSLTGQALGHLGRNGGISASVMQAYTFTLSANSVLTLSGNFYQSVAAFTLPNYFQSDINNINVSFSSADIPIDGGYYRELSTNWDPATEVDRHLWLAYPNTSNQAITVDVRFLAESLSVIYSDLPVAAVPEPSTWAMLGAGMLTLGALARRRTRHA